MTRQKTLILVLPLLMAFIVVGLVLVFSLVSVSRPGAPVVPPEAAVPEPPHLAPAMPLKPKVIYENRE